MSMIDYIYRGQIEVGTGEPGYRWANGYSPDSADGHMTAPWMTRADCLRDAKAQNAKARFLTADRKSADHYS